MQKKFEYLKLKIKRVKGLQEGAWASSSSVFS